MNGINGVPPGVSTWHVFVFDDSDQIARAERFEAQTAAEDCFDRTLAACATSRCVGSRVELMELWCGKPNGDLVPLHSIIHRQETVGNGGGAQ